MARRRTANKVTLATGHGAIVGRESGVHHGDFLIALDVTSGRTTATTEAIIRVASMVERDWLTPTRSEIMAELDPQTGTVHGRAVAWYDNLILDETRVGVDEQTRCRLLAAAWLDQPDEVSARLLARLKFAGIEIDIADVVQRAAHTARRLRDVVLTEEDLPWDVRQRLAHDAPDRLVVPSGRSMLLDYHPDGSVSVAVKLQELFGVADTPRLGPNSIPITFHLLAPNGRPVQMTRDLKGFWERTYPEVRKELRGRYPRHPWPDDPWTATPTHRTKKKSGGN